jgi:hypothetical protein
VSSFYGWLPWRREPAANATSVVPEREFSRTWRQRTGRADGPDPAGFFDGQAVWIRDSATARGDPGFDLDTAVHEILHRDAHPQANAALRTLALAGDDLGEGITELLTFRAVGPEDYRRLPNGYRRYAAAVGEDTVFLPYRVVTMAAEKIAADVGEVEVYRAFFENDPESLAAVLASARRHGFTDAPEGDVRLGERPIGSGQPDESPGEDDGIGRRAYYLWEVAGRPETPQDYPEGRSDFFWLQAKREASHLRPRIIQRAYQLWSRAGRPEGQRDVHWNRAQAQILNLLPEVEARANQLWLEAGRPEGQAEAHWQAAEDFVYAPQGSCLDPTPRRPRSGHGPAGSTNSWIDWSTGQPGMRALFARFTSSFLVLPHIILRPLRPSLGTWFRTSAICEDCSRPCTTSMRIRRATMRGLATLTPI